MPDQSPSVFLRRPLTEGQMRLHPIPRTKTSLATQSQFPEPPWSAPLSNKKAHSSKQESRAVAGKPRDAAINLKRYEVYSLLLSNTFNRNQRYQIRLRLELSNAIRYCTKGRYRTDVQTPTHGYRRVDWTQCNTSF